MRTSVACLITCLGLISPGAGAHLPEFFGRDYFRLGTAEQNPIIPHGAGNAGIQDLADQARQLEAQLQQERNRNGPYGAGQADPLLSLAATYRQLGRESEAIETYQHALYLSRVNDGLDSERQLPILRELIKLYWSREDFQALDGIYNQYRRAAGLLTATRDPASLAEALEYFEWQRGSYAAREDIRGGRQLLYAYRLNESLLDDAREQPLELSLYRELVTSQLRNLYLILGCEPEYALAAGTQAASINSEYPWLREIAHLQRIGKSIGRDLLLDLMQRAGENDPVSSAELHLELGDWYQWNGDFRNARQEYLAVTEILLTEGNATLLHSWLGEPQELPPARHQDSPPVPGPAAGADRVRAHFMVTSRGEVRRVSTEALSEQYGDRARRIANMLRDTHFRPQFRDGEPEPSELLTRDYRLR